MKTRNGEVKAGSQEEVYRRRYLILLAIMLGTIMGPLDASIVNVSLPVIADAFGISMASVGWVPLVYLLVLSSLLLTFGRMGDLWGYRRFFLMGLSLFVVASALCGLASNFWFLIAARALQAAGAAMFMAVGPALITSTFPPTERGRALGFNAMTVAIGLVLGPSLGGLITTTASWRWIFYINLPLGMIAALWVNAMLPPGVDMVDRRRKEGFDFAGAFLSFLTLFNLVWYLNQGNSLGWVGWPMMALVIAIVGGVLFIIVERRHPAPMLDLTLFHNPLFSAANYAALINYLSQYVVVFLIPFYLRNTVGLSSAQVGLIMTSFPLVMLVVAPLSGALSDRIGTRKPALAGALIFSITLLVLSRLRELDPLTITIGLMFIGLGNAIFQSPNNSAVMGSVRRERLGIASGILAEVRNAGMALGIAVAVAIYNAAVVRLSLTGTPDAPLRGMQIAFLVAGLLLLTGAVASGIGLRGQSLGRELGG